MAFCYSNRVDECTLSVFLDVCKTALDGTLLDVVLMTDDCEVYSNAWNAVMGAPAMRLLCTWHIDRAWRINLPRIKGSSELTKHCGLLWKFPAKMKLVQAASFP